MMAMCQQNIGNLYAFCIGKIKHLIDFPCGINNGGGVCSMVMNQVNEILHRSQFHAVNAVRFLFVLHVLTP